MRNVEKTADHRAKWMKIYKVKCTPIYVLPVSTSLKFHPVSVYDQFLDTVHFVTSAPNDHEITLNPARSNVSHVLLVSPSVKFQFFSLCGQPLFELQAILKKSASNDPKWPWNLQGHRYSRYVLIMSPSPIFSLHFTPRPLAFESQANLRQVQQMTPK